MVCDLAAGYLHGAQERSRPAGGLRIAPTWRCCEVGKTTLQFGFRASVESGYTPTASLGRSPNPAPSTGGAVRESGCPKEVECEAMN